MKLRHALVLGCFGLGAILAAPARAQEPPARAADRPGSQRFDIPILLSLPSSPLQPPITALFKGQDRLGWHRYQVSVGVRLAASAPDLSVNYWNSQLRPWRINAKAHAVHAPGERRAAALFGRHVAGAEFTFGLEGLESELIAPLRARRWARLWGPTVGLRYTLGDPSPHGGLRGGMRLDTSAKAWPKPRDRATGAADLRVQLHLAMPLPGACRHRLWAGAGWRALMGEDMRILRGGGLLGDWQMASLDGWAPAHPRALAEVVRGYEDATWYTSRLTTLQAGYRYPVLRQLELELFAVTAMSTPGIKQRRASGGAVRWNAALGRVPLALTYQMAYRFDDARGPLLHLLTASL